MEIIRLVAGTNLPVRATLRQTNTPRSTFYGWYQRYIEDGFDGLHDKKPAPRPRWSATPRRLRSRCSISLSSVLGSRRESWPGLLSLHHCLEAEPDDGSDRCDGDAR
ncbi:MAG: hypothetical protein CL933_00410 [Deltaproteobacteria bacterium]|nr:hypothetical protein [Deltaproteobacteria bacterium]